MSRNSPEYRRTYYLAHRTEILNKQKEYRDSINMPERRRTYYLAHKEHILQKRKAHYVAHKDAVNRRAKQYRAIHPEETAARNRIWREKQREQDCKWERLRFYKLSREAYDNLLREQGGACAICKRTDWNGKGPHIDHDHKTKKVRGILCHSCNSALGYIRDDSAIALAIINYLNIHRAKAK